MNTVTNVTVSDNSGTSIHAINFKGFTGAIFWIIFISLIVFIIAFATEGWAEFQTFKLGLWRECDCSGGTFEGESWYKASQAMFTIAFIGLVVTFLLACLYMIFHSLNKNTLLTLLIIGCFVTVLFFLIGLLIFGIEIGKAKNWNFGFSFAFACITAILCCIAGGMSVFQKIRAKQ